MSALISLLLYVITFICASAIVIDAVWRLNLMTHKTNHLVRLAYWLVACGAFAEIYGLYSGRSASLMEMIFIVGIGLLSIFDRRTRYVCPFAGDAG